MNEELLSLPVMRGRGSSGVCCGNVYEERPGGGSLGGLK